MPSLIHLLLRVIPALLPVSAFLEPLIVFIIVDLPVFGNPATIKRNVLFTPQIDPGENVLAPGAKLSLKNAPLYASSDAARAAGRVSGTYYTWDSQIIRNRIRITNSTANVGRPGAVTGWIGKEYLPAVNRPTVYIVVSGDTLSGIAARSGVSLSALLAANPQIKDPNRIYPGDRITIPAN